jgi:hypothetical protein
VCCVSSLLLARCWSTVQRAPGWVTCHLLLMPRQLYHLFLLFLCLPRARTSTSTGHVLPHIDRTTGVVDRTRPMPYYDYVAFLRSALVAIGLSEEQAALFAGHSARAGGATEAAAHGLHQEDIQHLAGVVSPTWLACYNRRYLDDRLRASRSLGL